MKKIIAFLLALLLPLCASAEPIRAQINAPEAYQTTFKSNTGRTVIDVDAAVTVPDAASVNVYEIRGRLFTAEEMERCAAVLFGDREYAVTTEYNTSRLPLAIGQTCTQYIAGASTIAKAPGLMFPMPESSMMVQVRQLDNGMMQRSYLEYERIDSERTGDDLVFYQTRFQSNFRNGDYSEPTGCQLSREDARAQADKIAAQITPHMAYAGCAITARTQGSNQSAVPATPEAWVFYYVPVYELPWGYVNWIGSSDYSVTSEEESLFIVVSDAGIENVRWSAPHEIVGVMEADVTLLPFEQVMTVASRLLPLSMAWMEDNLTLHTEITEIRLSYMRVLCQDTPDKLKLVPVWDFFGTQYRYRNNGKLHYVDDRVFHSFLTINAIDGTIIDRNYGY